MIKKGKIFLLAVVLLLALAQVAAGALQAVGPVLPDTDPGPGWSAGYNGFPQWYRDSLGQTVMLSVPPSPLSIPDPVIPLNAFSAQIGFGSEAMYWHSTALMTGANGDSLCVLALEAAFATGDAADLQQITFQRIRLRIDALLPGDYIVTHPYGTKTFTVAAADVGRRAINDTVDIGVTSFAAALSGDIGPLLKQVGAPAGSMGDAATPAAVVNGPNGNIFRVQGPGGLDVSTPLWVTGGQLFTGTPFNISRTTFTRTAAGAAAAEVFATTPSPLTAGIGLKATLPGQLAAQMRRTGQRFALRIPFTAPFNPTVSITGTINGLKPSIQTSPLIDALNVSATYSDGGKILIINAASTDALATLTGFDWLGAGNAGQPLNNGVATTFTGILFPPATITVKSSSGGSVVIRPFILP